MHSNNKRFLEDVKNQYPQYFTNVSVLEIGSVDYYGYIRSLFDAKEHIGVDACEGYNYTAEQYKAYGVDIQCYANQTQFTQDQFDVFICLSVFEHDPTWKETIQHNLQWLKPNALLIMSWGAEGNQHHGLNWLPVTTEEFHIFIKTLPIEVLDCYFEEDRYGLDSAGSYAFVGRYTAG